jgi:hypothetical protein
MKKFFLPLVMLLLTFAVLASATVVKPMTVSAIDPSKITETCDATNPNVTCLPTGTKDPALNGCANESCDIVKKYVNPLIVLMGILVGIAATIGIIWGGIEYSSSGGDPQKAASGKRHIVAAIIALIGYFFVYGLLNFLIPSGV